MQWHWGWAVLGAVLLGAGLVWWFKPGNPVRTSDAGPRLMHAVRGATGIGSGPTVYRWADGHGVVNFTTDKPPAGRAYTIVHIDPDQNVVPMGSRKDADR